MPTGCTFRHLHYCCHSHSHPAPPLVLMGGTAVSFTGGKDCVTALHLAGSGKQLQQSPGATQPMRLTWTAADTQAARQSISLLVTFAPPGADFKAHPLPVINAHARALQMQHIVCEIDPSDPAESYKLQIRLLHKQYGITRLVTGDILDIAEGFMQKAVEGTGVELVTPLWQQPRQLVLQALLDLGIEARISCVNISKYALGTSAPAQHAANGQCGNTQQHMQATSAVSPASAVAAAALPTAATDLAVISGIQQCSCDGIQPAFDPLNSLLGQEITQQLIDGPLSTAHRLFGADLCGEYGEYHTLVANAPMFHRPVILKVKQDMVCGLGQYGYVAWDLSKMDGKCN